MLERLTMQDAAQLLSASKMVAAEARGHLAARLMTMSGGIPLFLIEYLELLNQSPALINEPDLPLPQGIVTCFNRVSIPSAIEGVKS